MSQNQRVGLTIGGGVLLLLTLLLLWKFDTAHKATPAAASKDAFPGEVERYRTLAEITASAGGATVTNKVYSDCIITDTTRYNTGRQISTTRVGSSAFAVLPDRSILVLHDLSLCDKRGAIGEAYFFDPDVPKDREINHRIHAVYSHASRYDNVDDPKVLTIYRQQELFRGGIDGLRVTEAKLSVTELSPKTPLPDTLGEAFPWDKKTPYAEPGHPDYSKHDRVRRFSGFIVSLAQLVERQRCNKFDRETEGPILVTTDRWDECLPWAHNNMGWLVAKPSADLGQIDYSYGERSTEKVTMRYRATWLEERGAPGANEGENYFFWRPKLCIDDQCYDTHAARQSTWGGFRLYYPKKNQVITAEWVH